MAEKKRTPDQVERDRVDIARRYLQGEKQSSIAASLGLTQPQISYDLKIIRQRWLESSIRDFDAAKAEELAKIDQIEAELWEAWNQSKTIKEIVTEETGDGPKGPFQKTSIKREKRIGAATFLDGVLKCVDRRCAILGIDTELKYADLNAAIGKVVAAGYEVKVSADSIDDEDDDPESIEESPTTETPTPN